MIFHDDSIILAFWYISGGLFFFSLSFPRKYAIPFGAISCLIGVIATDLIRDEIYLRSGWHMLKGISIGFAVILTLMGILNYARRELGEEKDDGKDSM